MTKFSEFQSTPQFQAQVPVLPDVTFKDLPFYEELDVLIKPTSLVDHGPSRYQETALPFYLSQRQVQAIYDSRFVLNFPNLVVNLYIILESRTVLSVKSAIFSGKVGHR